MSQLDEIEATLDTNDLQYNQENFNFELVIADIISQLQQAADYQKSQSVVELY